MLCWFRGEREKAHPEGISRKFISTSEGQEEEEKLVNEAEGIRGPGEGCHHTV